MLPFLLSMSRPVYSLYYLTVILCSDDPMFHVLITVQYENFGYWRCWIYRLPSSWQIDGERKEWGVVDFVTKTSTGESLNKIYSQLYDLEVWYSKFILLIFRLSLRITISPARRRTLENGLVILDLSSDVMVQASAFCFLHTHLSFPFTFLFVIRIGNDLFDLFSAMS